MEESASTLFSYVFSILLLACLFLYIYFSAKIFSRVGFSWPIAFLVFIPFLNLIFLVMLVIAVKRVLDEHMKAWTWVLLLFIPLVNVIFLGMIALKKWPYSTLPPMPEGTVWIKKI